MLIKPSKVALFDHRAEPGRNKSFYLDLGLFETINVASVFLKTQIVDLIWQLLPNLSCILILPEYISTVHYAITYTETELLWMHQWCMCMSYQICNCLIKVTGTRLWYGWLGMQEKPRINKSLLQVTVVGGWLLFIDASSLDSSLWHSVTHSPTMYSELFLWLFSKTCGHVIPFPCLRNFPCHTSNL